MYSQGSILLGLSRIMTTFGGDILAWSAEGDINAGRGSKTTLVYTPPKREYDGVGNVKLSPNVPSTGAGIATLDPIPEVPPGDVDLIAPLGTIDAGEAGIRVSGNVNLAALQVVNAANIQVKGESAGLPVVASVNVSALTNASAAASQAAMAAQDTVQRERTAARQALPSIFTVRVLGFGNEPTGAGPRDEKQDAPQAGLHPSATPTGYDARVPVQVLGHGESFDASVLSMLSDEERRVLRRAR
jgi:post-segregation antitoxin (ccd killing protein)